MQIQRKITDFQPSHESMVVSRALVSLHKAVDEAFPHTKARERQFTKTVAVFGGPSEKTGLFPKDDELPPPPSIPSFTASSSKEEAAKVKNVATKKDKVSSKKKATRWSIKRWFESSLMSGLYLFVFLAFLYALVHYTEIILFLQP